VLASWLHLTAVGCRCDDSHEPPPYPDRAEDAKRLHELARASASARGRSAERARLASSVVVELRSQRLEIPPDTAPAQTLAFSLDHLAVVKTEHGSVLRLSDFNQARDYAMVEPRRVVTLADGAFLFLGREASLRVPVARKGARAGEPQGRVPLFAGSTVYADRRDAQLIWVKHPFAKQVTGFRLVEPPTEWLGYDGEVPLAPTAHEAFLGLNDGAFAYTAEDGWRRFVPRGRQTPLASDSPTEGVVRLLRSKRLDQLWVLRASGIVELQQFGARVTKLTSWPAPTGVFDLDANDVCIAFVTQELSGGVRRWQLVSTDLQGAVTFRTDLPPDGTPSSGEDWVHKLTANRRVLLHPREPLAVVGGPEFQEIWNVKDGRRLYASSTKPAPPAEPAASVEQTGNEQ
jgi:hypothetical protein